MKYKKLNPVAEYFLDPDNNILFEAEIMRAMDEFNGPVPIAKQSETYFLDWFLFDFKIFQKETPLAYFCRTNPLNLSSEQISILEEMRDKSVFGFFDVVSNDRKNRLGLKAINGEGLYQLNENEARNFPKKGGLIVCRLFKSEGDFYELASLEPICLDKPSTRDKKRAKELGKINSLIVNEKIIKEQGLGTPDFAENSKLDEVGEDIKLTSANFNGEPFQEYDNCPVCQLMKKAKAEGKSPTKEELAKAMEEANRQKK